MPKSNTPVKTLAYTLAPFFADYTVGDSSDFMEKIALRILSSDNADDVIGVMDRTTVIPLNVNLFIESVGFLPSDYEESNCGYFAVIQGKYLETGPWGDAGDLFTGTCGGDTICISLLRLCQLNAFPKAMRILQRTKPTAAGYYPLNLAPSNI